MVNWQVTATTIYCDAVDDEVTVLVYKDFTTKCTGYSKYTKPARETGNRLRKKSKQLGRQLECEGPECYRVTRYRDKLAAEEEKAVKDAETTQGTGDTSEERGSCQR